MGSSPKQNPNQTVTNNPPEYALPKLTEISDLAKKAYDSFMANGYNMPYQGDRSVGMNPNDQLSLSTAKSGADSFLASGAPQTTMDLSKFYSDKIFGGAYDPTQAIEAYARPITQNFTESIAPRLTSRAIDAGAYGGSKSQEFNNRAVRDTNQVLADTAARTQLAYDQAEKGAAGMVPSLADHSLQQTGAAADVYGNIGNTERAFQQQDINDDISYWNELTQSPFAGLGDYLSLVSGSAPGRSTTTYGYTQPGSNFTGAMGALGGLGGLSQLFGAGTAAATGLPWLASAGLGSQLGGLGALIGLSDKRLKENIKFRYVEKGHNIYSFNYLWDKTKTYLGVLAQELDERFTKPFLGFLAVDYPALGLEMKEA